MTCCCTHDEAVHLGGPDLDQAALEALHLARPDGDGGMCRAAVGPPMASGTNGGNLYKFNRCDCFNFCDCYTVTADDGPIRARDLL